MLQLSKESCPDSNEQLPRKKMPCSFLLEPLELLKLLKHFYHWWLKLITFHDVDSR